MRYIKILPPPTTHHIHKTHTIWNGFWQGTASHNITFVPSWENLLPGVLVSLREVMTTNQKSRSSLTGQQTSLLKNEQFSCTHVHSHTHSRWAAIYQCRPVVPCHCFLLQTLTDVRRRASALFRNMVFFSVKLHFTSAVEVVPAWYLDFSQIKMQACALSFLKRQTKTSVRHLKLPKHVTTTDLCSFNVCYTPRMQCMFVLDWILFRGHWKCRSFIDLFNVSNYTDYFFLIPRYLGHVFS